MPTQIQFKRGTTTPTGLTVGEPAFDTATSRLFVGNTAAARWMGGEITGGVDMGGGSVASQNRVPTQNAVYEYARRNFVASFNGATGAVTGASLGENTFTGLQTSATGFSGPLTGNATTATTATNSTQLGGVAAASYALLASPTFTGTPASTTAAIGTNTTQIATTAFVQNEIIADTVTAFNGRTGSVQGVSAAVAGDGISVSGATGAVTFTNTGVTRAAAGTGISVSANTGTVTITNTGVLSFNGNVGAVTGASLGANTFTGLQTLTAGLSASGGITFGSNVAINGNLNATTKSFVIPHPTRKNATLHYGSLEGPEHGVYVRGRLTGESTITLPKYWSKLVDEESITVTLTPIGSATLHFVKSVSSKAVKIGSSGEIDCFYMINAERKDVPKLQVEY